MSRLRRSAREVALTVGATLGLVCILAALAAAFLDVHLLVFRSGSMAPTVDTGGAALARTVPAAELEVGNIVSVVGEDRIRVTHRVVALEPAGDAVALTLRGDANRVDDSAPYVVTSAERVFVHVDRLGYVVSWLASPVGYVAAGAAVVGLLFLGFGGGGRPRPPIGGRRRAEHRVSERGSVSAPVALLVAGGLAVVALVTPSVVQPTMASWTDSATAGGTFSALTVAPSPSFNCGGLGLLSVTFSWTAVAGATSYTVHYGAGGSQTRNVTAPSTSTTITSAISSGTAWVVVNRNFGSVTWSSVASNTRTYTVAVVSLCG
ncbi:MAG: hypothetical protein Q8Q02_06765 [Nocardioides sp.]|nr:hypothetical protein [Nocardioides sp.]